MYIYIHIPFCNCICSYCDFCKMLYNKKYINDYLDSLEKEIKSRYKGELIKSIYIGGGTPSSLSLNKLERLFNIIKLFNIDEDYEFTIECNVDSLSIDKIKLFNKNKVNRVSLGVQSFNQDILKILNRNHTYEEVYEVINNLKNNNINNINIDLMYGVTNNIDIVKQDIDYFLNLDIPHISCYSLIIEDNTILNINNYKNIDEDIEYEMYKYIENKLTSKGYIHYEISNYAKEGYKSIHNINYWNNGCYYGFGLGSVSYIDNYRINNTRNINKYNKCLFLSDKEYEDINIRMSNDMILGLRKIEGISISEFYDKYKKDIREVFNIDDLLKDNILIINNDRMYINSKYIYLSNDILLRFLDIVN